MGHTKSLWPWALLVAPVTLVTQVSQLTVFHDHQRGPMAPRDQLKPTAVVDAPTSQPMAPLPSHMAEKQRDSPWVVVHPEATSRPWLAPRWVGTPSAARAAILTGGVAILGLGLRSPWSCWFVPTRVTWTFSLAGQQKHLEQVCGSSHSSQGPRGRFLHGGDTSGVRTADGTSREVRAGWGGAGGLVGPSVSNQTSPHPSGRIKLGGPGEEGGEQGKALPTLSSLWCHHRGVGTQRTRPQGRQTPHCPPAPESYPRVPS